MSSLAAALLAQTIDDHIGWMAMWGRLAAYETSSRTLQAERMRAPESFAVWKDEASKNLKDQPMLERLVAQYEQLHQMARLVVMKTPEGQPVAASDFENVTARYSEFVIGLRRLERALATAASGLDTLTGLRSRTGMQEDLQREMSRFQRNGKPFCLALMDIDYFKKINDSYGHESGDKILSAVANHVSRSLRPFDDAWRWGGEEFLLCLKDADISAGMMALERVRSELEKAAITLGNGRVVNITASFGMAAAAKDSSIDSMLAEADQALYRAKNAGRNRVETTSVKV